MMYVSQTASIDMYISESDTKCYTKCGLNPIH